MQPPRFPQNPTPPGTPEGFDAKPAHNPLDDDPELANIGPIDPVPPAARAPHAPARPDTASPAISHVPPLGPLADIEPDTDILPVDSSNVGADAGIPESGAVIPLGAAPTSTPSGNKIKAFEQKLSVGHGEENWKRTPTPTGTNRGACHVRSFHCKLTGDSLEFLDNQINDWLDAHPEYEVKMVTTSVGEWTGKLKEPALIINVWV